MCIKMVRTQVLTSYKVFTINVTRVLLPYFTKVTDSSKNSRGNYCSSVS